MDLKEEGLPEGELVALLETLLSRDDIAANRTIRDSLPILRVMLGEAADRIHRAAEAFNYPEALELLKKSKNP
ncbi:hypothetical protein MCP1_130068 [Candidatus Terasakiella magnetica]|nr:hypothetical protein MCP1_130068 [Candidatus Terasakiella magnetica]